MFPFLDRIIAVNPSPTQYAETLAVCLHPLLDNLYEALMEQLAADPGVFRVPGDERGPAGFMETWTRTRREQGSAATENQVGGGTGEHLPGTVQG